MIRRIVKENIDHINYITPNGFRLRLENDVDREISKLYFNNKVIFESEFGGAGAIKTKIYDANAIVDILNDIIFYS